MGQLVAQEIEAAGATLSGGTSSAAAPTLAELAMQSDAVIDFTHASTALAHARTLAGASCAWILGTTGLSPEAEAAVRDTARTIPVVWAANFSPGMTLLLEAARRLARQLPAAEYDAEITEMHHRQKHDAPSGTALALGQAVADGRGVALTRHEAAGPRPTGTVGFAVLRGGQVVGEHTLLFAGDAEHIALSHRALDRRVFARGAVRAALWARGKAPGVYGMEDVLEIGQDVLF